MRDPLHISRKDGLGVLERLRQVLDNDTTGQIRVLLDESRSLMSGPATDIHKVWFVRRPALGFLFKGIEAEAFVLAPPLRFHEEVEAGAPRRIAMDEVERHQVGFVAPLENAVGETGGVLVAGRGQVGGHFLIARVAVLKVELETGLDFGFGEVERVVVRGVKVLADFGDDSQCRQISHKTLYTGYQITCDMKKVAVLSFNTDRGAEDLVKVFLLSH